METFSTSAEDAPVPLARRTTCPARRTATTGTGPPGRALARAVAGSRGGRCDGPLGRARGNDGSARRARQRPTFSDERSAPPHSPILASSRPQPKRSPPSRWLPQTRTPSESCATQSGGLPNPKSPSTPNWASGGWGRSSSAPSASSPMFGVRGRGPRPGHQAPGR